MDPLQAVVLDGDNPPGIYQPMPPPPPKHKKALAPQESLDKFWSSFKTKAPGKVYTVLPDNYYAKRAAEARPIGAVAGKRATTSYEEAASACRAKVEKISKECRRVNQKYRDPHFDIEYDLRESEVSEGIDRFCLEGLVTREKGIESLDPKSVKRVEDIFEEPKFMIDGATPGDVRQGRDGDCWLMAAIATLSNMKGLIDRICVARDEAVGVYGFVFYRDGEWTSSIIDDKLYLTKPDYDDQSMTRELWEDRERLDGEEEYRKAYQTGSGALYFAQCRDPNETWLPLLEKAYAKAHGDYCAIEGGWVGEGIEDLTGGVTSELYTTDILDKEKFWKEELLKVNEEFLFGCATGLMGREGYGYRKGIVEGHAYSIMKAVEIDGQRLLLLRNPWGFVEWNGPWSDGSKEWTPEWMQKLQHRFGDDGAFWMSYKDLLRKYSHFDRTRLFGPDWTVTQQWTTLNVPWTVAYHDTKFEITLTKASPVVIVLSQLDSRYFRGLEGQYFFDLSFRLNKKGENDYLVRSHNGYCMHRSVSTDLDLEAGVYEVLIKIVATHRSGQKSVEEVVRSTCRTKRDKLLQIGLSYDLAHAKGQSMESEEQKRKKEEREKRKKEAEKKRRKENHKARMKKIKEREKKRLRKAKERAEKAKRKQELRAAAQKLAVTENEAATATESQGKDSKDIPEIKVSDHAPRIRKSDNNPGQEKPTEKDGEEISEIKESDGPSGAKYSIVAGIAVTVNGTTDSTKKPASVDLLPVPDDAGVGSSQASSAVTTDVSDFSESDFDDESEEESISSMTSVLPPPAPGGGEDGETLPTEEPWNAVCVVGLRVYSKDKEVLVQVITPKDPDDAVLDVDDAAVDATKDSVSKATDKDVVVKVNSQVNGASGEASVAM